MRQIPLLNRRNKTNLLSLKGFCRIIESDKKWNFNGFTFKNGMRSIFYFKELTPSSWIIYSIDIINSNNINIRISNMYNVARFSIFVYVN